MTSVCRKRLDRSAHHERRRTEGGEDQTLAFRLTEGTSLMNHSPNTATTRTTRGNTKRKPLPFLLAITTILATVHVSAEDRRLEQVVVTAQKREQAVTDVGIAISAFTGDQMEALGFEDSIDIIPFSPSVSMAGDIGGQRAIFNIRGVVQNDYADHAEAPVAVYVDGGYLASTQAQTFGLFDVERVEILKGPQGTLFGRNATGGLVNTVTRKPSLEPEGYVDVTGARFSRIRVEAAFGGPITEGVRGRLSLMTNQQDEIFDNKYTGLDAQGEPGTPGGGEDTYNDDTIAGRAQLEFDLGTRGSLLLIGNIADTTKSEGPYKSMPTTEVRRANGEAIDVIRSENDPLNCDIIQAGACIDGDGDGSATRPLPNSDFWGNLSPSANSNDVNKDFAFDDQNQIESRGLMAKLDYELDIGTFNSVTDYKNFEREVGLDSDQTPRAALIFQSLGEIDQFSQELRLNGANDRMNWVGGLYYLGIRTDFIQGLAESAIGSDDFALRGQEANTIIELDTDSYSAFGQIDYLLSDTLTLVAGARIIQENKDFTGEVSFFENNDDRVVEITNPLFTIEELEDDNDELMWSGKLQLEYSPDQASLYYAGINRGVKAGSFNAPLFGGLSPYDEETLLSYEVGTKLTLMDGLTQLNASAYYYDYEDYQSFSFRNNTSQVTNEDATYVGAEVEVYTSPTPELDFQFGASWIDAEVEDLQIASDLFRDTEPPFTPEWQFSGMARYSWADFFGGTLSAQLQASWQSEVFFAPQNFSAHELDSRVTGDARLRWVDDANKWTLAAFVDNFTDERDGLIGFDVSSFYGTSQISYTRPRSYGVKLRRSF